MYTITFIKGVPLMRLFGLAAALLVLLAVPQTFAAEAPKLVEKDGRYALLVDGHPFLILGGQIHNSSAWPSELPQVWQSMTALHANTMAAPVYWEQFEPQQGRFDCRICGQIFVSWRAG